MRPQTAGRPRFFVTPAHVEPSQYVLGMSEGRYPTRPLAPEDDWFAEPEVPPPAGAEQPRPPVASEIELRAQRQEPRRTQRPAGERNRRVLVVVIAGAVFLLVGGVLAARAFTGTNGGAETTTATVPTTTPTTTTPTTTTPTSTTPTTTTPTPTTPTTTTPTTVPEGVVLRRGDESEAVSQVQAVLVELGYSTGGVDGKFGPETEQAVRAFQASSGLADDGVVGPATLAALSDALNER